MFQHGDFLFTQLGDPANAISAVTSGYRGARVNHMGVVLKNNKGVFVLEAFPPDVGATQVEVFLNRSVFATERRYMHARLKTEHQHLITDAIAYGIQQYNVPYDNRYLTDEASLYCSELVVDMFKTANGGREFFPEISMNFRDLVTGQIHPYWIEHYKQFGLPVPQGEPGSNPGDISKHTSLEFLSVVGIISGYIAP
jgi:hypothetical protein